MTYTVYSKQDKKYYYKKKKDYYKKLKKFQEFFQAFTNTN